MRTLISNGTIVTTEGSSVADVLVDGETIALIGADLAGAGITADETIDASGKYVIPGAIDVHTHMELPFGGTFAKDTFETGTRAAAFGQQPGGLAADAAGGARDDDNLFVEWRSLVTHRGSEPLPNPRGRRFSPV